MSKNSNMVLIFCTVELNIPEFIAFSFISLISKTTFSPSNFWIIISSSAKNLLIILFAAILDDDIRAVISLLSASILFSLKILIESITSSLLIPKISLKKSTLESASTPKFIDDLLLNSEPSILLQFSFCI